MKKLLSFIFASTLLLSACGEDTNTPKEETEKENIEEVKADVGKEKNEKEDEERREKFKQHKKEEEEKQRIKEEKKEQRIKEKEEEEKEKEEEEKEKEKEKEKEIKKEFDPDSYNKEITYDDLARNPDDYLLEKITFEGKVIQVIKGDESSQYRLAANDNYDNVFLIEIDNDQLDTRILEDDYIRFYGLYMGEITYSSSLGGEITVPGAIVNSFDFK